MKLPKWQSCECIIGTELGYRELGYTGAYRRRILGVPVTPWRRFRSAHVPEELLGGHSTGACALWQAFFKSQEAALCYVGMIRQNGRVRHRARKDRQPTYPRFLRRESIIHVKD